ncbi:hypothetical protein B0H11DRAFT_2238250 [Mycena galericulata]|nr:hypothetical protein B0H11DRAFT_2238250 [Mycena galericulata]
MRQDAPLTGFLDYGASHHFWLVSLATRRRDSKVLFVLFLVLQAPLFGPHPSTVPPSFFFTLGSLRVSFFRPVVALVYRDRRARAFRLRSALPQLPLFAASGSPDRPGRPFPPHHTSSSFVLVHRIPHAAFLVRQI